MLPPFYEMGRNAAFSAIDAHEGMDVNLRADSLIAAAYNIGAEMEAESEGGIQNLPGSFFDLAAGQLRDFMRGYFEALQEAGR